jgi:hypothetical protein
MASLWTILLLLLSISLLWLTILHRLLLWRLSVLHWLLGILLLLCTVGRSHVAPIRLLLLVVVGVSTSSHLIRCSSATTTTAATTAKSSGRLSLIDRYLVPQPQLMHGLGKHNRNTRRVFKRDEGEIPVQPRLSIFGYVNLLDRSKLRKVGPDLFLCASGWQLSNK